MAAAEQLFRQALHRAPVQPDALRLLGEVLIDRARAGEAIPLLRRLVALHPDQAISHESFGNALRVGGEIAASIQSYRASLRLDGSSAGAHHGLGLALRKAEREQEALQSFRQAVRLQPGWATAWKDLGLALAVLGDLRQAEAALQRAVALRPGLGEAQRHLAAIRQDVATRDDMQALVARAADPATSENDRIGLTFAVARLADRRGDYDFAFAEFSRANALSRSRLIRAGGSFRRESLAGDVDRLIGAYSSQVFDVRAGWGNPSEKPVFIVGMPRSGSSLVEQIAASHSRIFGAGESPGIGEIAGRLGHLPSPAWTRESIARTGEVYLSASAALSGGAARIIDKMLDNVFHLGLIATLFPNARVIFCDRDSRDLALSCFFQHFAQPNVFDTDLGDIAVRIREMARLKAHWLKSLPLRCLTVSYEALLDNPEFETRQLIDFLGMPWEDQCLAFYETRRVVRTASWSQVRQPLYGSSRGRWQNYETHLRPWLQALKPVAADEIVTSNPGA